MTRARRGHENLRHGPSLFFRQAGRRPNKKRMDAFRLAPRRHLNLPHLAALRRPDGGRAQPCVRSGPWLFGRGKSWEKKQKRRQKQKKKRETFFFSVCVFVPTSSLLLTPFPQNYPRIFQNSLSLPLSRLSQPQTRVAFHCHSIEIVFFIIFRVVKKKVQFGSSTFPCFS